MDKENYMCKINFNNICKVMQLIFVKNVNMMDWKEFLKVDEGSTCHKPYQNRCHMLWNCKFHASYCAIQYIFNIFSWYFIMQAFY